MSAKAIPEVFTLEDASRYLRLPADVIERQARRGEIPGRRVGEDWRFLHSALQDWLSHRDARAVALRQAGALGEDPSLAELRASIYAERGRPEAEGESSP